MNLDGIPRQFASIQEALRMITDNRDMYFVKTPANTITQQMFCFYDTILEYIHIQGVFDLGQESKTDAKFIIYTHDRPQVLLKDVTSDFLVRCLYNDIAPRVPVYKLFATLVLSGIKLPPQFLCSAAGFNECYPTETELVNVSGGRFSWFRLLLDMGVSILTETGELIRDKDNNSILDIVSDFNFKYLAKAIQKTNLKNVDVPDYLIEYINKKTEKKSSFAKNRSSCQ